MTHSEILKLLPYTHPFLFVDELEKVSENGVSGSYLFSEAAFFYRGHFKDNPVTPGVILTECMAQIGVVCLGIFLVHRENLQNVEMPDIALTHASTDYYLPVFPGERVRVVSEKIYFRFEKLKCKVKMFNAAEKLVCKAEISGIIRKI